MQLDMRPRALQRRLALADELVALLPNNAELATHGAAAARRCMDAYIAGDPSGLRHARSDVARSRAGHHRAGLGVDPVNAHVRS